MSIHAVSKTDHRVQLILNLSSSTPLQPLPPSSIRIRTRLLALTTNVFSYARLGDGRIPGLNWWDTWPMPSSSEVAKLPDGVNIDDYVRVPAWGYSEVVESTVEGLRAGTWLFGYQPVGTRVEEVKLARDENVKGHWILNAKGTKREGLERLYNTYVEVEGGEDVDERVKVGRGW